MDSTFHLRVKWLQMASNITPMPVHWPSKIQYRSPHLCHLKHSHFVVHMVLEGDGPYLKPATAEGVPRRYWVVVLTLALWIREVAIVCMHVHKCLALCASDYVPWFLPQSWSASQPCSFSGPKSSAKSHPQSQGQELCIEEQEVQLTWGL